MSLDEPFKPRLNLLTAFPYVNRRVIEFVAEMGDDVRWLVDSGAFTAYKAGRTITVEEYCAFLDGLPVKPWRYFTLDVIGDPAATERNYQVMLDRGYRPIPVFTRGASLDQLDRMYETSDLVGLGGVAGREPAAYRWLLAVMAHAAGRRVHILGLASFDWVKHLRPYSVDASTWENGGLYGEVAVYLGNGRMYGHRRGTKQHLTRPTPEVVRGLRRVGVNAYQLAEAGSWTGGESLVRWAGCAAWVTASVDIERTLGTMVFLAVSAMRGPMMKASLLAAQGRLTDMEEVRRPIWDRAMAKRAVA